MKHVFRSLIFVFCLAWFQQAARAATQISVDVNNGYVIDGHNQVQDGIFGLTTYNGAPLPAVPTMNQALTEPGIRMLGFPGVISWVSPPSLPVDGAAGIASWYASPAAMDQITNGPLNGATYLYGQILPATEALGIHPMVYLLNGPSWLMSGPSQSPIPNDIGLYTATVTGYVGLLRRIDPQLKLFHLWNEPSSSWYNVNKYGADYAAMFNQIAQGVKQQYPDVLIGGPVLCCQVALPEAGPSYVAWEQWTKPVIENTGTNLDFFDYHAYDWTDSPDRSAFLGSTLEELNLVTNYMQLWKGKSVPVVISESGVALSTSPVDEWANPATHWQRRTWPWAQYLFSFLDRPDQILSLQMFDLMADIGNGMEFIRSDYPTSRSPTYWLYWLMRHTGGFRLAPAWSPIPGVQILATRQTGVSVGAPGGPYAAVTILNNSSASQDFNVQWTGASGIASWERLYLNGTQLGRDTGTGTLITLPAQSVGVVYMAVSGLTSPTPTMERDDFFGNTVMQDFPGVGQNLNFSISVPDNALIGMTGAYLQVGLLNSFAADGITLTTGDQTYPVQGSAYFQEIPLQRSPVSGQNTFTFQWTTSNHTTPVRISSVRLRIERQLSSQPPAAIHLISLNPSAITAGDSGFNLTINANDLLSGCTAYWNGVALPTNFVNATQVTALVPASYFVSIGTAAVLVINAGGGISNTLSFSVVPQATITSVTSSNDLSGARVYPNPFRSTRGDTQVTFDQMPANSTVKIFTVSTRLVKTLSVAGGIVSWDLTNDSGDPIASGIYLYLITDNQGHKTHGKFTIIR